MGSFLQRICLLPGKVVDPRHFGTDPDPRIRTTDCRILILPYTSVASKIPNKIVLLSVFAFSFLKVHLHQSLKIKTFLLDNSRIRIREAQNLTDPTDPDLQQCFPAY